MQLGKIKSISMLNPGKLLAIKLKNSYEGAVQLLGSISAALSCLICVPPREERLTRPAEPVGEERELLSQTAAGDRAYTAVPIMPIGIMGNDGLALLSCGKLDTT